jgi:WD40 repeat protein
VAALAFAPEGRLVAGACLDGTVRLWDAGTGQLRGSWIGHTAAVRGLAWAPDGKTLVSGGDDRTLRYWNRTTGKEERLVEGLPGPVGSVAWSPDGGQIAVSGGLGGEIRILDARTGKVQLTLPGPPGPVRGVVWASDGSGLAARGGDGALHLWDVRKRERVRRSGAWAAHVLPALDGVRFLNWARSASWGVGLVWSPDGKRAALAPGGEEPRIQEAETGKVLSRLGKDVGPEVLAWSPDGGVLARTTPSGVRLHETRTGDLLRTLPGRGTSTAVAWSRDGKKIAVAEEGSRVTLFDPATGKPMPEVLPGPDVAIRVEGGDHIVTTPSYRAVVEPDGCLTSLRIGGVEFLRPGLDISRGTYFLQDGRKPVLEPATVEPPAGNVLTAMGDRASIRYEFRRDSMRWTIVNKTDRGMNFYFVFSPALTAVQNDKGGPARVPARQEWGTTTWYAGPARLTTDGGNKIWPWTDNAQVTEVALGPGETRSLTLEVGAVSDAEAARVAAVTGERRVKTANYEATVESDGCLTSLRVGGVEMLYKGGKIARGSYFYQESGVGTVKLPKVDQPSPGLITASGELASARYEFAGDGITGTLKNESKGPLKYYIVLSDAINAMTNEKGAWVQVPDRREWRTPSYFAGKVRLTIPEAVKTWGPFEGRQVWEAVLKPQETRKVVLKIGATTEEEAGRVAALIAAGKPLMSHGRCLAWSPSGETLALGGDSRIFLLRADTGQLLRSLTGLRGPTGELAWSPDGKHLLAVAEGMVHLWDATTGTRVHEWRVPSGAVRGAAWAEDGRHVLSLGRDGSWCVHDPPKGKPVATLLARPGRATLEISPDGHYRGGPEAEKELTYVVLTDRGEQETLTPAAFAKKYGWKNDPDKVGR